MREYMR